MKPLLLLLALLSAPQLWAQTPVALSIDVPTEPVPLGAPVRVGIAATNTSDEGVQVGPLVFGAPRLTVEVAEQSRGPVPLYPLVAEVQRVGGLETPDLALPVGKTARGELVLDGLFDINRPGTYTVEVTLQTTGGPVVTSASLVVAPPPAELATAVEAFTRARRRGLLAFEDARATLGLTPPHEVAARVAADHPLTYLAEPALADAAVGYVNLADRWAQRGDQAAADSLFSRAAALARAFLDRYPTSPFAPTLAQIRALAEGGGRPEAVGVVAAGVCASQVFSLTNLTEGPLRVEIRGLGTGPPQDLVLAPRADTTVAVPRPIDVLEVLVDGDTKALARADVSDCPPRYLGLLVSPFEQISGAITASGAVAARFAGAAFAVSGAPYDTAGAPDPDADPAHAIQVATDDVAAAFDRALSRQQRPRITGLGPAPDLSVGTLPFDVDAFVADLADGAEVQLGPTPTGAIGTAAAPVVAYAPTGARLVGDVQGVGVLVVDGPFEMRGGASWTGLVVVRGDVDESAAVDLAGSPRIVGALLVVPSTSGGTLTLRGRTTVLYSPAALELAAAAAE